MSNIGECEDRFTAIALAASHSGDGSCRGDCGLRGISDPMTFNAAGDRIPLDLGHAPVMLIADQRFGRLPFHVIHVIDASFDSGERSAFFGEFNAGLHGGIAYEFHDLRAELLTFLRAIANAHMVHQVREAHDAKTDAACLVRGFAQLLNGRHIRIGFDHIIKEARGRLNRLTQSFPIDAVIRSAMLVEIDRTKAAVLVGAKPLFAAIMNNQTIRNK